MDLRDTDTEAAFRAELRAWLADAVGRMPAPPDPDNWTGRRADDTRWQRMLFDAGYAGVNWPAEYGGRGATPAEQLIFLEETHRAGAPHIGLNFIGLSHAGPTLIAAGTDGQKAAHLPAILRGDEIWCQGFSEPSAGSDLASLRTTGRLDGDDYVVNGQKIWTSFGHVADYCELLVRTDPEAPKHQGITWLIMPMDSPGVDVRPLRTAAGSTEYCEVFLDEVRIPARNRVGPENGGWGVAMVTLSFERGAAMVGLLLTSFAVLDTVVSTARRTGRWDDGAIRRDAGRVRAELNALWALTRRTMTKVTADPREVGGNIFKLGYTAARERLDRLSAEVTSRAGLTFADGPVHEGDPVGERLRTLVVAIAGGTTEIQRNIVAERALAMPRT